MVSITFDDGLASAYTNAIPVLDAAGMKSTLYVITGKLGDDGFITQADLLSLQARGHEIGAHTRTHRDLRKVSPDQLDSEIAGSLADLRAMGVPAETFAYPFGGHNSHVMQLVQEAGFIGARGTQEGFAIPTDERYRLRCLMMVNTTTEAHVKEWIDTAIREDKWLVLLFHHVQHNSTYRYSVTPDLVEHIVDYLSEKRVPVVTMAEGYRQFQQSVEPK